MEAHRMAVRRQGFAFKLLLLVVEGTPDGLDCLVIEAYDDTSKCLKRVISKLCELINDRFPLVRSDCVA
jgi:hypothetical protein